METVRVGVDLLDTLMNLVGELVLARNQLLQVSNTADRTLPAVRLATHEPDRDRAARAGHEDPHAAHRHRLEQASRASFAISPSHCGKEVRLEMEGTETELDRTIIEAIKDPLTHLIRNSIDHGIEPPEARRQSGQAAEGRVRCAPFRKAGKVNIEITDDGAGIEHRPHPQQGDRGGMMTPQQAEAADRARDF